MRSAPVSTDWIDLPAGLSAGVMPLFALSDVHGQADLMRTAGGWMEAASRGHALAILGDLTDRGPDSVGCLREALRLRSGGAFARLHNLRGNHCVALQARLTRRIDFLRRFGGGDLEKIIVQRDPEGMALINGYLKPLETWGLHGDLVLSHAIPDPRLSLRQQDWNQVLWTHGNMKEGPDWSRLAGRPALLVHGHVSDAVARRQGGRIHPGRCALGIAHRMAGLGRVCVDAQVGKSGILPVAEFDGGRMRMHYWTA